jgi:hypothetical protein
METISPKHGTPPFNEWLFLDFGGYFTFGRILKQTPSEVTAGDDFKSFNDDGISYLRYKFFIQVMTTVHNKPNVEDFEYGYCDTEFLSDHSDSIKSWAPLPYCRVSNHTKVNAIALS